MDINSVVQTISTLGFPAVMCIVLFWKMDKQDSNYKDIIDKMNETISANTKAIDRLARRINAISKQ